MLSSNAMIELVTINPGNTHHWGNYHCMADLLFDWFGLDQTSKAVSIQHKQSN